MGEWWDTLTGSRVAAAAGALPVRGAVAGLMMLSGAPFALGPCARRATCARINRATVNLRPRCNVIHARRV